MAPLHIGLTGSIGMGKSTLTSQLRRLGFCVFDADATVHRLYDTGGAAVPHIRAEFPHAVSSNKVDRDKLSALLAQEHDGFKRLERIVHPLVGLAQKRFVESGVQSEAPLVFFDIPLLFETKAEEWLDYTIVVTASKEEQRRRVLSRQGMTEEKLRTILSKQLSDEEKRRKADFVVHTNHRSFAAARAELAQVLTLVMCEKRPQMLQKWVQRPGQGPVHYGLIGQLDQGEVDIRRRFDTVIFDLDDTLVPTAGAVSSANAAVLEYLKKVNVPEKAVGEVEQQLRVVSRQVAVEIPLIRHDFTELKWEALNRILTKYEVDTAVVDAAVETFLSVRGRVEPYLYDDVLTCLQWLRKLGMKCVVLTDGNARLAHDSPLHQYFDAWFNAGDVGVFKPSWLSFFAALSSVDGVPSRALCIGDSYEKDVLGCMGLEITSVYIQRENVRGSLPASAQQLPDIQVTSLTELKAKLVDFTNKAVRRSVL